MDDSIAIASDHAGFELKEFVRGYLSGHGYKVADLGTSNCDSVNYVDYGIKLGRGVSEGKYKRGVLICGTGIGMSMTVNRFRGIRGALCHDTLTARLSRLHNDANVLVLGGRLLGKGLVQDMIDTWLNTEFEGGRHQARLDKISEIEDNWSKGEC
ncbi:MAG: ribose 5-phosphate isomerase B [Nitrospinota bacterium]